MTNHLGIGVNGCGRTKHIVGGDKDEEARRDRRLSFGMPGGTGTSVKSPEPYLMPDQNKAITPVGGSKRAVRFDCSVTSRGGAQTKLSKGASLFNGWKTGRGNHLERVTSKWKDSAPSY